MIDTANYVIIVPSLAAETSLLGVWPSLPVLQDLLSGLSSFGLDDEVASAADSSKKESCKIIVEKTIIARQAKDSNNFFMWYPLRILFNWHLSGVCKARIGT